MTRRRITLAAVAVAALLAAPACGVSTDANARPASDPGGQGDAPAPSADCATAAGPSSSPVPGGGTISKPCPESESASESPAELPADFVGTWVSDGPVTQTPPVDPYTMTLTLRPGATGEVVGAIDYPELGCSGTLTLVDAEPDVVTVTEEITDDPEFACVPTGTIELTPTGAGLDYAFTAEYASEVTGSADLVRA